MEITMHCALAAFKMLSLTCAIGYTISNIPKLKNGEGISNRAIWIQSLAISVFIVLQWCI